MSFFSQAFKELLSGFLQCGMFDVQFNICIHYFYFYLLLSMCLVFLMSLCISLEIKFPSQINERKEEITYQPYKRQVLKNCFHFWTYNTIIYKMSVQKCRKSLVLSLSWCCILRSLNCLYFEMQQSEGKLWDNGKNVVFLK